MAPVWVPLLDTEVRRKTLASPVSPHVSMAVLGKRWPVLLLNIVSVYVVSFPSWTNEPERSL